MNYLEKHLQKVDPGLFSKFHEAKNEIEILLQKYSANFPTYTDHSINHTMEVFKIASELLSEEEVASLGADETYILSMSCILHDVGMCIPEEKVKEVLNSEDLSIYKETHPNLSSAEAIRDIHHTLSKKFIINEWELLKIPTEKYATAIGLVAEGHRKVDLGNLEIYDPEYFAKSGKESVCLPYLGCILRIADELDVTNSRVPKLLTKYYMPNNETSVREWSKHMATSQRNYRNNQVIYEVDCTDQNIYAALQDQFDKIQSVINYCQKVIRAIPYIKGKHSQLNLSLVEVKYNFKGFHPKGIRFSFDVQNVVTAFIGEDLYKDNLTSLREAVQNSIDSCRYKSKVLNKEYDPFIRVYIEDKFIQIEDNGAGMDEFIIENFFGRLASSFYEQEKIKTQFEAIGQFGVGVFSYFLIAEYVDIETKTEKNNALKFRFDKDPKSYFHFYDRSERNTTGTTITLYLKEKFIGTLSDSNIESYLRRVFKHIEIPFRLEYKTSITHINYKGFEIDSAKEIKDRLKLQFKKVSDELEIKQIAINDEEIEGVCGLIVGKEYQKIFSFDSDYFDHEQFYVVNRGGSRTQISICQKGVFVNHYSSASLDFLIGDINLKSKIKINIDRNGFTNGDEIVPFVCRFEIEILKNIFAFLEKRYKSADEAVQITDDFFKNYYGPVSSYTIYSNPSGLEFKELWKKYLHFGLFNDDKSSIVKLEDLLNLYKEFILISDKEDKESIFKFFQTPVVTVSGNAYQGAYSTVNDMLSELFMCYPSVVFDGKKGYQKFEIAREIDKDYETNSEGLKNLFIYHDIAKSTSKKLFLNIWRNKDNFSEVDSDSSFINYNHYFFQFVFSNYKNISENNEYFKIVKAAYGFMNELQDEDSLSKESLKRLNEILSPLNNISKLKKITASDF